jgi:hypothetical protein
MILLTIPAIPTVPVAGFIPPAPLIAITTALNHLYLNQID